MVHYNSKEFPADPRQLPTNLEAHISGQFLNNPKQLSTTAPNTQLKCCVSGGAWRGPPPLLPHGGPGPGEAGGAVCRSGAAAEGKRHPRLTPPTPATPFRHCAQHWVQRSARRCHGGMAIASPVPHICLAGFLQFILSLCMTEVRSHRTEIFMCFRRRCMNTIYMYLADEKFVVW